MSLSYIMIAGSLVYYFTRVTELSMFLVLLVLPFVAWAVARKVKLKKPKSAEPSISAGIWAAIAVIALVAFFVTLAGNTTLEASRSPWLIAPHSILVWLGVAGFSLFMVAKRAQVRLSIFASIVSLFAAVSVALFVFPMGYGFDPFLHQATIDHITLHGSITPKPFYYIGQYALEFVTIFTTGWSSHIVDTYLLPVLASILLPVVAATSLFQITKRRLPSAIAAASTLLLPISHFINTTPQGLANLWSLIIFFLALPELLGGKRFVPHWALALLALAAILVHPLAGLPAALFVVLAIIQSRLVEHQSIRITLTSIVWILGAIMLPVAFAISGPGGSSAASSASLWSLVPPTFFSTRYDVWYDLLSIIGMNQWIWIVALAVIACAILWKMSSRSWLVLPLVAILLIVNAIILASFGDFSFLIDYEQTNYVDRVISLAILVLAPLSVVGVSLGVERLLQLKSKLVHVSLAALFAVLVISITYNAYPRHDAYAVSRGFTVGTSDHDTVASIEAHSEDESYIVLANQAVSAAAIADYGFAHYYKNNEVFYYPVPTGGPMYQVFLEMIEEVATQELAETAMDLAGVDKAYFVVNEYWWSAEAAIERARLSAEDYFTIDDGAVWVFIYSRQE